MSSIRAGIINRCIRSSITLKLPSKSSKRANCCLTGLKVGDGGWNEGSTGLRRRLRRVSPLRKGAERCASTQNMVCSACVPPFALVMHVILKIPDGLPSMGHACGHNLIATSSIASAVGVEAVMKARQLPGTLIVMGTPAEESAGGKWIMAKNGAWRGVDACMMTHGMGQINTPVCVTKASWKLRARFRGKTAHGATAPWTGRNACDAIVHAYTGIALLRQHIEKSQSIQGCILEAGKAANLIPDYSEGVFSVRAPTIKQVNALRIKVEAIFEAAASATGCTVEQDW